MAEPLSVQSQAPTGSSDGILPLGDSSGPPGAPNDITKGVVNAPVPAHYYTYLPRLELGLLSSKQCLRLLPLQDEPSPSAEPPGAGSCLKLETGPRDGHPLNESQRWYKFPLYGSQEKNTDDWTQLGSQPQLTDGVCVTMSRSHTLTRPLTWQAAATYISLPTDKSVLPLFSSFIHFHVHADTCSHVHRGQRWMLGSIPHHSSTLLRQDLSIKPRDHGHG
jgi:hypothetical protein